MGFYVVYKVLLYFVLLFENKIKFVFLFGVWIYVIYILENM